MAKDQSALPFPTAAGYATLALNGAKGGVKYCYVCYVIANETRRLSRLSLFPHVLKLEGATKYLTLQYLNYARWTAQQHSCSMVQAP